MQPSEAAVLLAKVSAFDRRTIGEADAHAWAEVLTKAEVGLVDALAAVTAHFGGSNDWLMPRHVIDRVRGMHADRLRAAGVPDMPPGLDQAVEREWAKVWRGEVAGGAAPDVAAAAADARFGVLRPVLVHRPELAELLRRVES